MPEASLGGGGIARQLLPVPLSQSAITALIMQAIHQDMAANYACLLRDIFQRGCAAKDLKEALKYQRTLET